MGLEEGVVLLEGGLLAPMPGTLDVGVTCFLEGTAIGAVELLGCLCVDAPAVPFFRKG